MPEQTRIIISDLHIGQNDNFDIFKSADKLPALAGLLSYWGSQNPPVELIVNGDFVDFLQLRPWTHLGRQTALDKVKEITQASADVFKTLGELLRNPENTITVLLGNHDIELAYPEVWAEVEKAILVGAPQAGPRLKFLNDRTTYNVSVNGKLVHVEHGNANDPWNTLNYTTLFQDAETHTDTFRYPPGTNFVFDVMNKFKEQFRFVDLLKPEMPAVPLILLALRPWAVARELPQAVLDALAALGNGFLAGLRRRISGPALTPAAAALSLEELLGFEYAETLSRIRPELAFSDADDVENFFLTPEATQAPSARPTLGKKLSRVKHELLAAAFATLERVQTQQDQKAFFAADHPTNRAATWAESRLVGDVRVVVFGHTHEALKTEFPSGLYLNSGAWANLIRMPQGGPEVLSDWLRKIADNTFDVDSFPTYVRLTPCVRLTPSGPGVLASLNAWQAGKEQPLWQKTI